MNDSVVYVEGLEKLSYQPLVAPLIQKPSCVCDEVGGLEYRDSFIGAKYGMSARLLIEPHCVPRRVQVR